VEGVEGDVGYELTREFLVINAVPVSHFTIRCTLNDGSEGVLCAPMSQNTPDIPAFATSKLMSIEASIATMIASISTDRFPFASYRPES
jgi:hypothetical protein